MSRTGLRALAPVFVALALLLRPATVGDADPPAGTASQPAQVRHAPSYPDVAAIIRRMNRAEALARQARLRQQQQIALLHQDFSLHGVDTQLYTAWNQPFTIKAVNWYGFEYAPFVAGGLNKQPLDFILMMVRALGFNALRLTYADETVRSNPVVTAGLEANPALRGLHSLDIMQRIIKRARVYGLRVILCNSRSEGGMGPEIQSGLWYTARYPESTWEADWVELVTRFAHDSNFVGADLRNEPHITGSVFDTQSYFNHGPLWGMFQGTYYHDRDWHYAAEMLGNRLLQINPRILIIVEGVQMYLDPDRNKLTGALWGSNLIGVQYDPITLIRQSQLVYSVHEYGPKMWKGKWFNVHTTYETLAHRWDHLWGYLFQAPRSMRAPIFVGEFGTCNDYYSCIYDSHPDRQGFWFTNFVRYLAAHPQVGWAYWSLNPEGPFRPQDDNFYSVMSHSWRWYHPMLLWGLKTLLTPPGPPSGPVLQTSSSAATRQVAN